jgi:hypothetical protein
MYFYIVCISDYPERGHYHVSNHITFQTRKFCTVDISLSIERVHIYNRLLPCGLHFPFFSFFVLGSIDPTSFYFCNRKTSVIICFIFSRPLLIFLPLLLMAMIAKTIIWLFIWLRIKTMYKIVQSEITINR